MGFVVAKLKCHSGRGRYQDGTEAVTEVANDGDSGRREDHLKGGRGKGKGL